MNDHKPTRKPETELNQQELDDVAGGIVSPRDLASGQATGFMDYTDDACMNTIVKKRKGIA